MNTLWYVYILKCSDGTLYTGITRNMVRRLKEHNASSSSSAIYTKYRRPVSLVYKEKIQTRSEALKREAYIKKLSRSDKEKLL